MISLAQLQTIAVQGQLGQYWQRIDSAPVDPNSNSLMGNWLLTANFGTDPLSGMPFSVVTTGQPLVPINVNSTLNGGFPDQSDPGPYPIPTYARVEGESDSSTIDSSDRHVLIYCTNGNEYDLYHASTPNMGQSWTCDQASIFNFNSPMLRPADWTSADAAGLPIIPFLITYADYVRGYMNRAIRITMQNPGTSWCGGARHAGGGVTKGLYYGARIRLTLAWFNANIANFTGAAKMILTTLRYYGAVIADAGQSGFLQGCPGAKWDDTNLATLHTVPSSAFELVQVPPACAVSIAPASILLGQTAQVTIQLPSWDNIIDPTSFASEDLTSNVGVPGSSVTIPVGQLTTSFPWTPKVRGLNNLNVECRSSHRYMPNGPEVATVSIMVN